MGSRRWGKTFVSFFEKNPFARFAPVLDLSYEIIFTKFLKIIFTFNFFNDGGNLTPGIAHEKRHVQYFAFINKKSIRKFCIKSVLKKKDDLPALVASPLGRLCMMNRKCSIEIVESCNKDNYYSPEVF
jgi:hypothetical protein